MKKFFENISAKWRLFKSWKRLSHLSPEAKATVKKYRLNDINEQNRLVEQYHLIQQKKGSFSLRERRIIEDKVRFMVHNRIFVGEVVIVK